MPIAAPFFICYAVFARTANDARGTEIANFCPPCAKFGNVIDLSKPRPRGRPTKSPLSALRTQMWCAAVFQRAAVQSAHAIEELLYPDQCGLVDGVYRRPEKWDHYLAGRREPLGRQGLSAVDVAEARFPGTAAVFHSPLWRALEHGTWTELEIVDALRELHIDIANVCTSGWDVVGPPIPRISACLDERRVEFLVETNCLDAVAALVLFVRLSETIASPELRRMALSGLERYDGKAPYEETGAIAALWLALFRQISVRCKHWAFIDPTQRSEIVVFGKSWEGDIARHEPLLAGAADRVELTELLRRTQTKTPNANVSADALNQADPHSSAGDDALRSGSP